MNQHEEPPDRPLTCSQLNAAVQSIHLFQYNKKLIGSLLLQAVIFPKARSYNDSKNYLHHFILPSIRIYSGQDSNRESQELNRKEKEEKRGQRTTWEKSCSAKASRKLKTLNTVHARQFTGLKNQKSKKYARPNS